MCPKLLFLQHSSKASWHGYPSSMVFSVPLSASATVVLVGSLGPCLPHWCSAVPAATAFLTPPLLQKQYGALYTPALMLRACRPNRCASLSCSSRAAFLVKVMTTISWGCTPCCWISQATRWVRTRVFPLPGPAISLQQKGRVPEGTHCEGIAVRE